MAVGSIMFIKLAKFSFLPLCGVAEVNTKDSQSFASL
jgi:hypothetical protein